MRTCQQLNLKNKLSKQEKQRQNHGYGEYFDSFLTWEECVGMGEEEIILSRNW